MIHLNITTPETSFKSVSLNFWQPPVHWPFNRLFSQQLTPDSIARERFNDLTLITTARSMLLRGRQHRKGTLQRPYTNYLFKVFVNRVDNGAFRCYSSTNHLGHYITKGYHAHHGPEMIEKWLGMELGTAVLLRLRLVLKGVYLNCIP